MFQYAVGRRLACLHNVPLKLDLTWFSSNLTAVTPRVFLLNHFRIQADLATDEEIASLRDSSLGKVRRFLGFMNTSARHIRGNGVKFDESILLLPDNVLLEGYWQSEKYFIGIKKVIQDDFTICEEPDSENSEVISVMHACNSVSIHIRRGDYVTDAKAAARHGTCSDAYYKEALNIMSKRVYKPYFFVFTDDPDWVREQFIIPYPMTLIDHNSPVLAYEDLRLMSSCKHHIIANSSFSWWGAWLNPQIEKTVIAPSRWFSSDSIDTSDLIPESWLRL